MAASVCPDIVVYVCGNCIPPGARLPQQWKEDGARVVVRHVPCSGKMDGQYLLHALEAGGRGLCVVACPKGECHLAQGNYRAEIRIHTLQRLLSEIGIEPQRAELLHCAPEDPPERLQEIVRAAVGRICGLGESPLAVTPPARDFAAERSEKG